MARDQQRLATKRTDIVTVRQVHKGDEAPLVPVTARGEATRRRILDAAEDIFGAVSYYEASITAITRRAGVAQGTFYLYFHSKREIFVQLVRDLGQRLRAAIRAATFDAHDRLAVERRGFQAFFQFVVDHRRIYHIVQEAERVAPEAAAAYYANISDGYQRGLAAAMESGEIAPAHVEAIAAALMGIGHFVALRWLIWPQPEGGAELQEIPPEVVDAVIAFITHGLSPAREE
jgi:AcrR family transcriptional regulator